MGEGRLEYQLEELERRRLAMGHSQEDWALLRRLAPKLEEHRFEFVDFFYTHLRTFKEPASLLRSEQLVERLKKRQLDYFHSLLNDEIDADYVAGRLRVGEVHHQIGLRPNWYVAAFSIYLTRQLPLIESYATSREEARAAICALVRRVVFDISLALDAYSVENERQVLADAIKHEATVEGGSALPSSEQGAAQNASLRGLGIGVSANELEERRTFHLIDDEAASALKESSHYFSDHIEAAVDVFHDLVLRSDIDTKIPLSDESLARLKRATSSYWNELFEARFDRPYAVSRVRVGMVHERIGISLQWYLVALALQLTHLVSSVMRNTDAPMSSVAGLLRASMYDTSYIIDAYMEARIQTLLDSHGFAEHLVRNMTTGMLIVDEELRVRTANKAVLPLLGISPEALLNVCLPEAVPELPRELFEIGYKSQSVRAVDVRQAVGDKDVRVRMMRVHGDGTSERLAVLLDDLSPIVGLLHRTEVEQASLRKILEQLHLASWEADGETGVIEFATTALDEFVPGGCMSVLGRKKAWEALVAPPDRESFGDAYAKALRGESVELEHRILPEEEDRWVRTWLRRVDHGQDDVRIHADVHEVTHSARARRELSQRLEFQRGALEFARATMVGGEDKTPIELLLKLVSEPAEAGASWIYTKTDGSWSLASSLEPDSDAPEKILSALGEDCLETRRVIHSSFGLSRQYVVASLRWDANEKAILIVAAAESNQSFSAAFLEFTETMAALGNAWMGRWFVDKSSQARQRLELLGTLAGGVAHDLNNVLGIIQLTTDVLEFSANDPAEVLERVQSIRDAVSRGRSLTGDILGFAREEREGGVSDLQPVLAPLERLLRAVIPTSIAIEFSIQASDEVSIDRGLLEQIVINLVTNASHAIGARGRISVRAEHRELTSSEAVKLGELTPGSYVLLQVEDDGPGVPLELRSRIFEPFFTSRPSDGGTGLGLPTAARMAYQSGGGLRLAPEQPEQGARFELWLRTSESEEEQPSEAEAGASASQAATIRVLLAEDEPALRETFSLVLRKLGIEVVACPDGVSAIDSLGDDFDVVVADYNMPGASGADVLMSAMERCPDARLICTSGQLVELPAPLVDHGVQQLMKPYTSAELVQLLSERGDASST